MKKHLLLLIAILLPLLANAQTKVEIDEIWYNLDSETMTAEVKGGNGWYYDSITIPSTVNYEDIEYSVTSIGEHAFNSCDLTSITLPTSITSIGEFAFSYCTSLTSITIPESVTSIGDYAFYHSEDLTSVTIPQNFKLSSIGEGLFMYCESLTDITIPESVTSIGAYAFYGCSSLKSITIPARVSKIVYGAFTHCSSLTAIIVDEDNEVYDSRGGCNAIIETSSNILIAGCSTTIIPEDVISIGNSAFFGSGIISITLPDKVESIGHKAFERCTSLTSINLPESVTYIGDYAFVGCSSLTSIIIPKNVVSLGNFVFFDCSSLTSVTISEGVKRIEKEMFRDCTSLTSINIPQSTTSIGDRAFSDCHNLLSINIPNNIETIENNAFFLCSNLASVHINSIEAWCKIDFEDYDSNPLCNSANLYLNGELVEELEVPNSIDEIKDYAFLYCNSLTSITLPSSVMNIGNYAFSDCSNLTTITCKAATAPSIENSYAFREVNKSIPVYVPVGSVEAYKSAEYWSEFTNIIGVEEFKCATPTISYADGKLLFACDTEGAEIKTRVLTENDSEYTGAELEFIPTHTFTAYATMSGFEDSDIATLTLCWIPCGEEHENEDTDIVTIPSKPVLISTQGGTITVSGLAADTEVEAYSTTGTLLATATTTGGTVTLDTGLEAGSIAIVKIGEHSVKIAVK